MQSFQISKPVVYRENMGFNRYNEYVVSMSNLTSFQHSLLPNVANERKLTRNGVHSAS